MTHRAGWPVGRVTACLLLALVAGCEGSSGADPDDARVQDAVSMAEPSPDAAPEHDAVPAPAPSAAVWDARTLPTDVEVPRHPPDGRDATVGRPDASDDFDARARDDFGLDGGPPDAAPPDAAPPDEDLPPCALGEPHPCVDPGDEGPWPVTRRRDYCELEPPPPLSARCERTFGQAIGAFEHVLFVGDEVFLAPDEFQVQGDEQHLRRVSTDLLLERFPLAPLADERGWHAFGRRRDRAPEGFSDRAFSVVAVPGIRLADMAGRLRSGRIAPLLRGGSDRPGDEPRADERWLVLVWLGHWELGHLIDAVDRGAAPGVIVGSIEDDLRALLAAVFEVGSALALAEVRVLLINPISWFETGRPLACAPWTTIADLARRGLDYEVDVLAPLLEAWVRVAAEMPAVEVAFAREFVARHGFDGDRSWAAAPAGADAGAPCLHPGAAAQVPLAEFLLDAITAEPMDAPPR